MSTEAPTLDLKKTINLPKTKFAQKANLPQSEPVRLKAVLQTAFGKPTPMLLLFRL